MRTRTNSQNAFAGLLGFFGIGIAMLSSTSNASGQISLPPGIANVKDFRATGDGVTDDTVSVK